MRVHFSSVATAFVALLFVLGTVGCKHTGGDWYKPSSYAWGPNSISSDSPGAPRSFGSQANPRPSLNDQPNVNVPPGGYSDGPRATAATGTSGGSGADPWGQHQTTSQVPPGHLLGGFTEPAPSTVPSHYPPDYLMGGNMHGNQQGINQQSIATAQQQFAPHHSQHPQEMWHQQGQMPYGHSNFGATQQTAFHQQHNPSVYQQPHTQHILTGHSGIDYHQGNQSWGNQSWDNQSWGGQAPHGTMQQMDPFGGAQQAVTVPSSGFGHDQHMQMQAPPHQGFPQQDFHHQQGFQGSGVPVGIPHQSVPHHPHQPPPASGFPTQGGFY